MIAALRAANPRDTAGRLPRRRAAQKTLNMLRNYFKTALRNLLRNKSYAAINIIGLSVGIAACLLIFLVVQFELSFDTFHEKKNKIYRVMSEFHSAEGISHSSGVPFPVGPALRIDYPQLEKVAGIYGVNNDQITITQEGTEPKKFMEDRGIFFAEPEFFQLFDFPLIAGNIKTALKEPNTALLTQETAERYFGDWKKAVGKTIKYENAYDLKITGILKNVPANTDFPLKVVGSYETLKNMNVRSNLTDWVSTYSQAYLFASLPPELSADKFNAMLKEFVKKHKPAEYNQDGVIVQPVKEMHFDNRFGNFNGRTFGRDIITALTLIGLFLLIIACVNFINLATAQAVNRSRAGHAECQFLNAWYLQQLVAERILLHPAGAVGGNGNGHYRILIKTQRSFPEIIHLAHYYQHADDEHLGYCKLQHYQSPAQ